MTRADGSGRTATDVDNGDGHKCHVQNHVDRKLSEMNWLAERALKGSIPSWLTTHSQQLVAARTAWFDGVDRVRAA